MMVLDPERAYLAVLKFLKEYWERAGRPQEVGMFAGMSQYTPGQGTSDPAMWYDWLAAIRKVQDDVVVPDHERERLTPGSVSPLTPEQAYLSMFRYIEEYWDRVNRPPELGDLLGLMRYTAGAGTADPGMWQSWLAAVREV